MNKHTLAVAFVLGTSVAAGAAHAVQVAGAGTPRADAKPSTIDPAARAAMRDDSDGLVEGVIDAIDAATGNALIQGRLLHFDPSSAQVFGVDGGALPLSYLHRHQRVRFLLDGSDAAHSKIRVFYLP